MLAIFPAIIALVTIYGMVADPAQVESQVGGFAKSLPSGADQLLTEQLKNVVNAGQQSLSIGLALSLLAVLWSVSSGVQGLVKALNVVYDEPRRAGSSSCAACRCCSPSGRSWSRWSPWS
jgi:membrane protein